MTKLLTLVISCLALSLGACVAPVDGASCDARVDEAPAALSCDMLAESSTERVISFADPDTRSPGGTSCVSLGGGVFTCPADFCLFEQYTGTCPHCPGGGE